ncbi:hypothetical protein RclHR1_11470002 [Rhizophagus clarus]|uniref:Uncharacterized protein n=1 Tax=Rhizophagus clarus TaxID=94130 RepID=A0A2Z6QJF8_9GLOM|nr:hypothetical protein RclHR1_11470002 [Rhizophagus clarus]
MVRLLNSFTLLCKEYNPHNKFVWDTSTCVCDFRINIHECPEQEFLKIINWVLMTYCLLLTIVSSICLYHLIYVKKQPFFLPARKDRGILRPRPQHMYYALALIYCPWQIIHILQLTNDLYPNVAWAEIYSTGAIELDTTLSLMESKKPRNLLKIDIACITLMLLPLITFLPLAGLTGYYADIGNIEKANNYFIVQNIFWVIWGIGYVGSMIYFWSRLIPRVKKNINDFILNDGKKNLELNSILEQFLQNHVNITSPSVWKVIPACLYLLFLLLYVILHRSNLTFIYGINVTFIIFWNYGLPIFIHVIQWVMIYNTHVASKIPPNKLRKNNKKVSDSNSNNNGRNRRSTIIGCGNDERSDTISLAYHNTLFEENYRYSFSSTKISNSNNNNNNNFPPPTQRHNSKKDSYHSTHSYYTVDIKSKKTEWIKNDVRSIPINNDDNFNPRFSLISLSDNNNNINTNTRLSHSYNHSYSSNSSSNAKLIKKTHRNTTPIVNNYY